MPFLGLPLPFHCLSLTFHCFALPLPFTTFSLPFLDLPLPFHRLSLTFRCQFTAFLGFSLTFHCPLGGQRARLRPAPDGRVRAPNTCPNTCPTPKVAHMASAATLF